MSRHPEDSFGYFARIWQGWTKPEKADADETLLKDEIFVGIRNRQIPGYRGIELLRRNLSDEVEFVTIMWFDSIASVLTFVGDNYEIAVVAPKARAVLARFDERSAHYETIISPPQSVFS